MSAGKRTRQPNGRPRLKLSRSEADILLLEAAPALGLQDAIAAAPGEGRFLSLQLDLGEWEDLAGYLSKQAFGLADPKRQDRLDRLIERIEDLIDEADEP